MPRQFIRMSDLDRRAREDVELHLEQTGKKMLGSLLGSATQRDWLDSARGKYASALDSSGFERVTRLIAALFDVYRSRYRTPAAKAEIEQLVGRIETSYANVALEYLDSRIHGDVSSPEEQDLLQQAIRVLEEENPRMAQNYAAMLHQAVNREEAASRFERLLDLPAVDIDLEKASDLARVFSSNEKAWRADPGLYDSMLARLRNTMEGVFLFAQDNLRREEDKTPPSLRRVIAQLERFAKIHAPLKPWTHDTRYQKFIDRARDFEELLTFLDREFPALRKTYNYLGLPRDNLDHKTLLEQFRKIDRFTPLLNHPWKEIAELDPPLSAIAERIEQRISESHRKELIQYHKTLGDLLGARDGDEKIRELIRFFLHLKTQRTGKAEYLALKIESLLRQVEDELTQQLERRLRAELTGTRDIARVQRVFDYLLSCWAQAENLEKVEETQSRKMALLRDLNRFRELTGTNGGISPASRSELRNLTARLAEYPFDWIHDWSVKLNHATPDDEPASDRRLVLMDRLSPRNLVIYLQDVVTLGRSEDNDIVLASEWISSRHAELDFRRGVLTDLGSTNGTFLDERREAVKESFLTRFDAFDLAHSLVFRVRHAGKAVMFALDRVPDGNFARDPKNREALENLRNTEFVHLPEEGSLSLDRETGRITDLPGQTTLRRVGNRIFFTDLARDLHDAPVANGNEEYSERFSFHWV
jgi:hypothetical protein